MSDGITAIGVGIAEAENLNQKTEITTGAGLLNYMSIFFTLSDAWSKTLTADAINCEVATINTLGPNAATDGAAAGAARTNAILTSDESAQSEQTGNIRTLIDNHQALLRSETSSMETMYNAATPIGALLHWISGLLRA